FARRDLGSANVFGRIDRGQTRRDILRRTHLGAGARLGADRLHGQAVTERDIMMDLVQRRRRQFKTGGVDTPAITEVHEPADFVDGEERLDAIAQAFGDIAGVIRERFGRLARLPSADTVLQRLRQVPMIEGRKRLNPVREEFVQEAIVEVEAFGVRRAGPVGKYPRPCDRKSIGFDAEPLDQANVFLVAMIVIVGAVAVAVIPDLPQRMAKSVPYRLAPAVFLDRAFDLIGGCGGAPDKAARKTG